ncbi:MAG: 16S rRNA (guanine(527)-N(7))-methyltransferase RsmG [Blastocatellia bacterium]
MRSDFIQSLELSREQFGLALADPQIEKLADYFELVQEHNPLLHLVGPCKPGEFATRHILESLTLINHLRNNARFADVGTGAGLPSIPCLIVREDLSAVLIESKEKKARFLTLAVERLGISSRIEIVNQQFSETILPDVSHVTCRALDRFAQKLPVLLKWSGGSNLLLFGGPALRREMENRGLIIEEHLMPMSEQRFLFICRNAGKGAFISASNL